MKAVAFVGAVLVLTAALVGSMVLLVVTAPGANPLWAGLAGGAVVILMSAGITLGSVRAYWDVEGSQESRRIYRRWQIGVVVAEVGASVLLVAFVAASGAPAWVVVLLVGVGIAFTAIAPRVGAALRRSEARRPVATSSGAGAASAEILVRPAMRGVAITFPVAVVVCTVGLLVIDAVLGGVLGVGMALLYAASLALLATAVAGIVGSLSANRRLRSIASDDLGRVRRFGRAVFRGKAESFTEDEQHAVLEYARVAPVVLRLQIVYLTALYGGLALQQVASILQRPDDALMPLIVLIGLGAVFVLLAPIVVLQVRRAARYLERHGGEPMGAS